MSPLREPSFFSLEVRPENFEPALQQHTRQQQAATRDYIRGPMDRGGVSGIVTEWEDYIRLFAGVRDQPAIGEASVCYLWSPTAAKTIASVLPHARILIILRDPADRAFCQYLHNVSDGLVRPHSAATSTPACSTLPPDSPPSLLCWNRPLHRAGAALPQPLSRRAGPHLALRGHHVQPAEVPLRGPAVPRRRPRLHPDNSTRTSAPAPAIHRLIKSRAVTALGRQ